VLLVSSEVGSGVVPPFPLGRVFRDLLGLVNQALATAAGVVLLVIAGIPVDLRLLERGI
jgi:adenosylcobinamide kinase / adenosylcobinamide-phosphate guanylyltransferase